MTSQILEEKLSETDFYFEITSKEAALCIGVAVVLLNTAKWRFLIIIHWKFHQLDTVPVNIAHGHSVHIHSSHEKNLEEDGPFRKRWRLQRRMDHSKEDGPFKGEWTIQRRMDHSKEDGPSKIGWTIQRRMDHPK